MSKAPTIEFTTESRGAPTRVLLVAKGADATVESGAADTSRRALKTSKFEGKLAQTTEVLGAEGDVERILFIGLGEEADQDGHGLRKVGGTLAARLAKAGGDAEIVSVGISLTRDQLGAFAEGILLASYRFERHKTTKKDDDNGADSDVGTISIVTDKAGDALGSDVEAVVAGVNLARDLTSEPANVLGPVEMAERAQELTALGVEVEVLEPEAMEAMGMGALLGVAQGSVRPARLAVMRWNGGEEGEPPLAIVGKAVMFDTGGISIKPAGSMEEMKGDMGGGATVVGLMHALAARKARANVVGLIGCVENMPDGNAQRPGDIVTSANGQTIEVINTDAEGRLVLADVLWYAQEHVKPSAMVDLATLTGAVLVALGSHNAGLFSNNDDLAAQLHDAGQETGDRVWRLPLDKAYDKLIDSKFADMKNVGGRYAGAITAAQFLQRFVTDGLPWAHLDIAGTAISAPQTETNTSWASGFGVRLLNQWIKTNYEG